MRVTTELQPIFITFLQLLPVNTNVSFLCNKFQVLDKTCRKLSAFTDQIIA
jgi:hypothetical protein